MKEIAETIELAKKHAKAYIQVPCDALYEIMWTQDSHIDPAVKLSLDSKFEDTGPMLIVCLGATAETAEVLEQVKKYSVYFVEVPANADYGVRWYYGKIIAGKIDGSGPILFACLID